MTADRSIRTVIASGLSLASVFALATCDTAQRVVDADDRERFIDATNEFTRASNQLQDDVEALEGRIEETPAFVEGAQDELATMEEQRDEIRELAESVDGEARSVAQKAAETSTDVLRASREIVDTLAAGDAAALQAALQKCAEAIDAFNEQVSAWNDL